MTTYLATTIPTYVRKPDASGSGPALVSFFGAPPSDSENYTIEHRPSIEVNNGGRVTYSNCFFGQRVKTFEDALLMVERLESAARLRQLVQGSPPVGIAAFALQDLHHYAASILGEEDTFRADTLVARLDIWGRVSRHAEAIADWLNIEVVPADEIKSEEELRSMARQLLDAVVAHAKERGLDSNTGERIKEEEPAR